jgi:hypothetical protein
MWCFSIGGIVVFSVFLFFYETGGEPLLIIYLKLKVTKTSTANQETKKVR